MNRSFLSPGLSEVIVCQSKTTQWNSTATLSTEFILWGQTDDTEDIRHDKRSKEAIKETTREGICGGVWEKSFLHKDSAYGSA